MARLIAFLAAFSILFVSGTIYAQKKGGADSGGVLYKKQTKYDFDDDVVEGDLVRPDGEFVDVRDKARYGSLITIRADFMPEMLKSAEDI